MAPGNLLSRLSDHLSAQGDIVVAIAFGSIIRGTLRPDSDVDIAVLTDPPMTAERARRLIGELAEISGRPVDLVDLRNAGVVVRRQAMTHGRRLVCRDQGALAAVLSRMLVDAADFLPLRERILKERREAWTA